MKTFDYWVSNPRHLFGEEILFREGEDFYYWNSLSTLSLGRNEYKVIFFFFFLGVGMTKKDEGMIKGIEDNLTREKRWNDLFDLFDRKKKKKQIFGRYCLF